MSKYYQMASNADEAEIVIYGDITSWPWVESDVSSYGLAQELAALPDTVKTVRVRINSYGGEVAEGVAIYNALRNSGAHVVTECDGFACSIASVIFMAGDERIMNGASLLMIHNASSSVYGTAEQMRKAAEDLDTVTELSKGIYIAATDLDAGEIAEWMDAETFIDADTALAHGFATEVKPIEFAAPAQDARELVARAVMGEKHEPKQDEPKPAPAKMPETAAEQEPQQAQEPESLFAKISKNWN